jgi:two-component system phosphorelay protein LuxU
VQVDFINTQVLTKLAEDVSIENLPSLIDVFLAELDTRLTAIETAPLEGDENHLRIQIHSIKSCARTFGATELANKAAEIEKVMGNSDIDITSQIQQLLALLPTVKQMYLQYKATIKLS